MIHEYYKYRDLVSLLHEKLENNKTHLILSLNIENIISKGGFMHHRMEKR